MAFLVRVLINGVAIWLAVLHQAVVLDEREHAVAARVEGLELVEAVAVGLEDVDVVLRRMRTVTLRRTNPSARSAKMPTSFS